MSKGKVFCAYPYVSLFVANSGKQFPCCYAQNAHATEVPMPNISEAQHIQDLWNSKYIRKVREIMSEEKFPAACGICKRTEDLQGLSHRQRSLEQFAEQVGEVLVDESHEVTSAIRHLDLRLGNKCNLACRMCHPASSNQLIPEWLKSDVVSERKEAEAIRKKSQWSHLDESIALLQSEIVNPVHLHLAGGEPAIDKKHERVLEHLIASHKSQEVTLSYNTNLTHIVPGLKWREHFKRIMIHASIDGIGALNEYIRYPSKWPEIDRHLRQYIEECNRHENVQLEVNVTVSAYNILFLKELLQYFAGLPAKRPVVPVFTLVHDPEWLKISVLPQEILAEALEKLRSVGDIYADEHANILMHQRLVVFHQWLKEASADGVLFDVFCDKTEFFDRQRNCRILDVMPELKKHWRKSPMLESFTY